MPTEEALKHIKARKAGKEAESSPVGKDFAERMISYYNSWISDGERPSVIVNDLTTASGGFREDVQGNSIQLIDGIGKRLDHTDDETHAAVKRVGDAFKIKVRDPKKPKAEPQAKPQPQPQPKAQKVKQPQPPKPSPDGKQDTQDKQPQAGKGQPKPEEDKGDAEDNQGSGSDGQQDGEDNGEQPGDTPGQGESGDQGAAGGSSRNHSEQEPEDVPIDLVQEKAAFKDMRGYDLPEPEKSRLTREEYFRDRTNFDFGRTNGLMAKLRDELASIAKVRKFSNRTDGEVDFEKVADIASHQNMDRIYYTQRNARKINTAVQIIMDVSSSTNGSVNQTITGLAHVIAGVLEKMKVPVQVISFDDSANLVKDWHEKVSATRIQYVQSRGSTNLPSSQTKGAKEFKNRREKRKVQFVITDGDVGWQSDENLAAQVKAINEYCDRSQITQDQRRQQLKNITDMTIGRLQQYCPGIESYAFGVGVALPRGIFEVAVSNLTPANMCDAVAKSMGKALMNLHRE